MGQANLNHLLGRIAPTPSSATPIALVTTVGSDTPDLNHANNSEHHYHPSGGLGRASYRVDSHAERNGAVGRKRGGRAPARALSA